MYISLVGGLNRAFKNNELLLFVFLCFSFYSEILSITASEFMQQADKIRLKTESTSKINTPLTKQKRLGAPQTIAYLRVLRLKKQLNESLKAELKQVHAIIEEIKKKEWDHFSDYYVFYHGQRTEHRLFQDVIKEVMSWFNLKLPALDFLYLRAPHKKFESTQTVNQFLDTNNNISYHDGINHDILLSVNLSLFGNTTNIGCGESTFKEYFLDSWSPHQCDLEKMLKDFFKQYNFNQKFIPSLLKAYKATETKEGNLLQIFIPKSLVDSNVYLAEPCDPPYPIPIVHTIFDYKKNRHIRISPILDLYRTSPTDIEMLDALQARILINKNILSPDSGIKMYRYTTVQQTSMDQYYIQVKQLVKAMITEWIATHAYLKHHNPLANLARTKMAHTSTPAIKIIRPARLQRRKRKNINS